MRCEGKSAGDFEKGFPVLREIGRRRKCFPLSLPPSHFCPVRTVGYISPFEEPNRKALRTVEGVIRCADATELLNKPMLGLNPGSCHVR